MALSPHRAHYLKKSLLALQLHAELAELSSSSAALACLGPPFAPRPGRPPTDLPLVDHLFRRYVLSFPFMAAAPDDFYAAKLQPFLDSLLARNLSPAALLDDPRPHRTPTLVTRLERNLVMLLTSALKLVEPEDVLRLSQADLLSLERALSRRRADRSTRHTFHVNIVSVRAVSDRGRVRSRVHEEFIICTTLARDSRVYVSRRYGDFRTLADELRKAHPDATVPSPPQKDRTSVGIASPIATDAPRSFQSPSVDSLARGPSLPGSFHPASRPNGDRPPSRLSREKNRLTLRAYLHTLLATPPFTSSPVLRSFLFSGPTTLSPQEQLDVQRREEADRVREQGKKKFASEISARVDQLREAVRTVRGEIVGRDGLTHLFSIIKVTPNVRELPDNYQAVLEWARISLASTIFQTFAASDNSSETFAGLKRIHGLMPYFLLKAALKISNPVAMIRTVLDIFLAQPFGGRSLLQRMFTSSLNEEVKTLNTYIEHVSAKINSPILCEKIRSFVYASREVQEVYTAHARRERTHLLRVVLLAREDPVLSRSLAERVDRARRKWDAWMAEKQREGKGKRDDSDSEEGPDDEEAWFFEDLRVLIKLYSKLRDREQLIALIFEGVTADLLKDIITIFYTPLAQVYRAASIAESLGDLQNFVNDLISTVEQTEDLSQSDPSSTVQAFIDLVNRHEQSFYSFVHKVHSKGQGLFDGLMKWIERFLTAIREGIGATSLDGVDNKIALETLLPAGGEERTRIMEEIDEVIHWHYLSKLAHEEKLRRRFRRAQTGADAEAEDEATQVLINDIAREFDFGELTRENAAELAAEESDEEEYSDDDDDDDDDDESDDDSSNDHDPGEETDSDEAEAHTASMRQTPSKTLELVRVESAKVVVRPTPSETAAIPRSKSVIPAPSVASRPRSFSLRSTKSMKLLRESLSMANIPPVPSLPIHLNKPLPPRPPESPSASLSRTRSTGQLTQSGQDSSSDPPPSPPPSRRPRKPRRKAGTTPQPPELKYIPTLLPVFVELMRPLLRSQP